MNTPISQLKRRPSWFPLAIDHFDMMQSLHPHFVHLGGNGVPPISCQTVYTGTHKEVSPQFTRSTEQFINGSRQLPWPVGVNYLGR